MENDLLLRVQVVVKTLNLAVSCYRSNDSTKFKKRASRLSFLIPQIVPLFSGVVFAVSVRLSLA